MAKITNTPTGRPNRSYKKLYEDLQVKYNNLLEVKVGIVPTPAPSVDTPQAGKVEQPTKKEEAEEVNSSEAPIEINSQNDDTKLKKAEETLNNDSSSQSSIKSNGEEPAQEVGENLIETSENSLNELELVEAEVVEEKKINPNDYDYRCSSCKELFMEDGNKTPEGQIKCPDCGELY